MRKVRTEAGPGGRKVVKSMVPEEEQISAAVCEKDVDALVELLDGCTRAGESRIKVDVVEGDGEVVSRQYHHGRCDIGSPWACGAAFDILE